MCAIGQMGTGTPRNSHNPRRFASGFRVRRWVVGAEVITAWRSYGPADGHLASLLQYWGDPDRPRLGGSLALPMGLLFNGLWFVNRCGFQCGFMAGTIHLPNRGAQSFLRAMKFGYTILYVPDVLAAVEFYERAFGIPRRFVVEGNLYAEMETGATTLAFAAESMAELNQVQVRPNRRGERSAGIEIAWITDDPYNAYQTAISAGAEPVHPPSQKPWGQTVAYVRDLNGCLVEIGSPVIPT